LIDGEAAAAIGLVNYAMKPHEVLSKAWEISEEIETCALRQLE